MIPAYILSKEVIEQRIQQWDDFFLKVENSDDGDKEIKICDLDANMSKYSTDNLEDKKMKPKRQNHHVKLGHSVVTGRYKKMNARIKSKQHGIKWKKLYKKFGANKTNNNFRNNKPSENLEGNEDNVEQHKHKTNVYENPRTCTKIKGKEVFVKINNLDIDFNDYTKTNINNKEIFNKRKEYIENNIKQVNEECINIDNENSKNNRQTITPNNNNQMKDEYLNMKISETEAKNKIESLKNKNIDNEDKKYKQKSLNRIVKEVWDKYKNTDNKDGNENIQTKTIIDKNYNGRHISINFTEVIDEHTNMDNIDIKKNNFQSVKVDNTNIDYVENKEKLNKRKKYIKNNVKLAKEYINNINRTIPKICSTNNVKNDKCTNIVYNHKMDHPGSSTDNTEQFKNENKNVTSSTHNIEQIIDENTNDDNIDSDKTPQTDTIGNKEQQNDEHTIMHIELNEKRLHKRKKEFVDNHSTKKRKLTNLNIVTDLKILYIREINGETVKFYDLEDYVKKYL